MYSASMHEGMEGPHLFEITVKTNDPANAEKKLLVRANWAARDAKVRPTK
ncbi:MAG: hypothetical protein HYX92_12835 [Chloroflexi bacterium]|nr:hypothetical protein [Chloroflexota bacterium]